MNFRNVRAITIPEGHVMRILAGTKAIWKKFLVTAGGLLFQLAKDGTNYRCVDVEDSGETSITVPSVVNSAPVKTIGADAFSGYTAIASVTIAESVDTIEENAFAGCTSLKTVRFQGDIASIDATAFSGLSTPTFHSSGGTDFSNAPWGTTNPIFYIDGIKYRQTTTTSRKPQYVVDAPNSAFIGGVVHIMGRIGDIIVSELDSGTFKGYTNITEAIIPAEIKWIEASLFQNCTNLKKVTFKSKPSTISTSIFSGCTGLTDIYVPWAEGAVSGAPWGAPANPTIHYNYTS